VFDIRKLEGERDGEFGDDGRACGHSAHNNGSAADKDQGKRANELGYSFFHVEIPQRAPQFASVESPLYRIQSRWAMSVGGTERAPCVIGLASGSDP
jgi:hypothetical protein